MDYLDTNRPDKASQLVNGASNISAICASLFLLPFFVDFPEDFDALINSFEAAFSLRILFSWISIWFTLTYTFKGILAIASLILGKFERLLNRPLRFLKHDPFSTNHHLNAPFVGTQGTPFSQDDEGVQSKPLGKGFKFPMLIPLKFLKKFQITAKRLGMMGFANGSNIWNFKLSSKFLVRTKAHKSSFARHGHEVLRGLKKGATTKVAAKKSGKVSSKSTSKAKIAKPKKSETKKSKSVTAKAGSKPAKNIAKPKAKEIGKSAKAKALKVGKDFFKKVTSKQIKTAKKAASIIEKGNKETRKNIAKEINYNAIKTAAKFYAKHQMKAQEKAKAKAMHGSNDAADHDDDHDNQHSHHAQHDTHTTHHHVQHDHEQHHEHAYIPHGSSH